MSFFVIFWYILDLSIVDVEQANVCWDKGSRTATLDFASVLYYWFEEGVTKYAEIIAN